MTYEVWTGEGYASFPAATSGGESVMTPNVNGLVYRTSEPGRILLQRRDKPGEVVRGRLELPGGRWRAGETPEAALVREVEEETGVTISEVMGVDASYVPLEQVGLAIVRPRAVVSGFLGAYPSLHVVLACRGEGTPRPLPGETAEPRWWRIEDVRRLLDEDAEAFVWHAHAMLRATL